MKPSFITNPIDKEKENCMCKIRLNFCLKLAALMNQSKRFNGPSFDSVSSYYRSGCKCSKGQNAFWISRCVEVACSKCNNKTLPQIPNLNDEILSYNQFAVQSTPYLSKKTKVMKTSTQTVRQIFRKM